MIIAKKAIPRRTVLRGLGSVLALPLLDSMVPALSALQKTPARPINRFGVMYVPNGMIMKNYLPLTEGAAYELTPTLSALAPFREQVLVLSGLECIPTPGRPGGAHAKASTRFLTDVSPPTERNLARRRHLDGSDPRAGNGEADAAGVARAGDRVERDGGRVRHRIRVSVHQHDQLEEPEHAAADAEQPARRSSSGCSATAPAPIRRCGSPGCASSGACSIR